MKKVIVALAVLPFCSMLQAQIQTGSDRNLDEVIVTASKKSQKQSQTGKVVTVIDRSTLVNNRGKSLTEILNQFSGVFTVGANNAPGSNQELYLRGAATGNTLFLLDGVPLQDPNMITNTYDLNNINPDQIERIEILKGAQSTLWGSAAVAGVVNIITKKGGPGKIGASATVAYGSYNTWKAGLGVNGSFDRFSYNLHYNRITTDGFSAAYDSIGNRGFDKDGLKQDGFQANLGYRFSPSLTVNYTNNYGFFKADADGGAYQDDKDVNARIKNMVNSMSVNYKTSKSALRLVQSFINSDRFFNNDSTDIGTLRINPSASSYTIWSENNLKGHSIVTDLYGNHDFNDHISLVAGLQHTFQKTVQTFNSISNASPPFDKFSDKLDSANVKNFSGYVSALFTDVRGFNLEVGGRLNHNSLYGNNTTFTVNPSYNVNEQTRVFVNISSGYNVPTLYQLYSEYGNRDLEPEKSINYELGVQTFTNDQKNSLRLVAFKRDIKDLIIYYSDPETFASKYMNRDEQNDYGFEVESNIAVGKIGQWVSNFTYVNGRGINAGLSSRNLFRRPNFTVNSTLSLNPVKNLTVAPAFRYIGERIPGEYDLGGPNPMPAYYTIDFYASYAIKRKINLFADLRNITDQKYFDVYGYNSRRANYILGVNFNL